MTIATRKGTHKMHLPKTLQVFILLIMTVKEFQANAMNEEDDAEINISRELTKRGASAAAPNDYGPAIKITSSILQLTKSAESSTVAGDIGLERHETTIEHPWPAAIGYQLPAEHTVWLEIPANTQDFHLLAAPSAVSGNAPEVSGSMPDSMSQFSKGLHTQIISSSGKDVTHVSDNLDLSEVNENKAKRNHRTSYGR